MRTVVKPYADRPDGKKQQVAEMFDNIAGRYDRLNRVMSAGIDVKWRRKAIRMLQPRQPQVVLDVATGTADFALEALRLNPRQVIGVDISEGMLERGREKVLARAEQQRIELRYGDSENLPLPDNFADAITVGFGVRNFENLERGLAEMLRVLKPGGVAVVLEPSFPQRWPMAPLYRWYFTRFVPWFAGLWAHDTSAYRYLPESVTAFPQGQAFLDICRTVGYREVRWRGLSSGICALYWLEK
jgi:demethylmenaquinone methyltransferase/2-methoxy-6-polyprenyl-1,4-benzoquinol methylase